MPRRLPLDVPVPVRISPRLLFALEDLLAQPDVADRYEECLLRNGVEEDATEDTYEHVRATFRRALEDAERRNGARAIAGTETREVSEYGTVVLGGVVYAHDDLKAITGEPVVCRLTRIPDGEGGTVGARVELLDGTAVCVATPLRLLGGKKLAA